MSDSSKPLDLSLKDNTDASRDPVQSSTQLNPSPNDASQDTVNARLPLFPTFEDNDDSRYPVQSGTQLDASPNDASQNTLNFSTHLSSSPFDASKYPVNVSAHLDLSPSDASQNLVHHSNLLDTNYKDNTGAFQDPATGYAYATVAKFTGLSNRYDILNFVNKKYSKLRGKPQYQHTLTGVGPRSQYSPRVTGGRPRSQYPPRVTGGGPRSSIKLASKPKVTIPRHNAKIRNKAIHHFVHSHPIENISEKHGVDKGKLHRLFIKNNKYISEEREKLSTKLASTREQSFEHASTEEQSSQRTNTMCSSTMEPSSTLTSTMEQSSTLTSTVEPSSTLTSTVEPSSTLTSTVEPSSTLTSTVEPSSTLTSTVEPSSNDTSDWEQNNIKETVLHLQSLEVSDTWKETFAKLEKDSEGITEGSDTRKETFAKLEKDSEGITESSDTELMLEDYKTNKSAS